MKGFDRIQVAGQHHLHQQRLRQHPQQGNGPRATAPGDAGFGDADLRALEADAQIRVQAQHHAAGNQVPGHGRDDGLGHTALAAMERVLHLGQDVHAFFLLDTRSLTQVEPGAEGAAVGRSQDCHAYVFVGIDFTPQIVQPVGGGR